eukprot:TRINITY_DN10051_c0_g1_i3.p1 TRINITY_DN10051_c0_g1~~TRINITY_DN10051_c0_g1_i3.p1  ORF type:complete len:961 (+),score=197.84 TRINITY_DN10051_c0_g1_i3:146-2884(+)
MDELPALLCELIAARQELSQALTLFSEGHESGWYASSLQAVTAVTSTVSTPLLAVASSVSTQVMYVLPTAMTGAFGAGSEEASVPKTAEDELQKCLARDERAELFFYEAISKASDGAALKSWLTGEHVFIWCPKLDSLSLTQDSAEQLQSRLQVSLLNLLSLAASLPAAETGTQLVPSRAEEAVEEHMCMITALAEFQQKRKFLLDWLVSYVENFDPARVPTDHSRTMAALTTMAGGVLLLIPTPPTAAAGAVCVASGVGLGYASSGGMNKLLTRENLQSLIDEDEKACAIFQHQLSQVLAGTRRSDGGTLDLMTPAHRWELRGIEQWAQTWFQSLSCGAGPISDITWFQGAECRTVPMKDGFSPRDAVKGLHRNLLDSLEQLQNLERFLRDLDSGIVRGLAFGQLTELFPADVAGDDVVTSPFAMLSRSLDELIQERGKFIVQLQELASISASNRKVASSSKTVTALGVTTGATMVFCPAIGLPAIGILTMLASGLSNSFINGTETMLDQNVMDKLQKCFDDDRAAELAFDQRLRSLLQKQGQEEIPAHHLMLLDSWVSEANQALADQRHTIWDMSAALEDTFLSLKGLFAPIDCVHSWVNDSKTTRSVQQVCEYVTASQHKLLHLQRLLSQIALSTIPPLPTGFENADFELVSMSGLAGNRQVSAFLDWVLPEHQGCWSCCDAGLREVLERLHDLEHTETLAEQSEEMQTLAELAGDLIEKRQALVNRVEGWFSSCAASATASTLAKGSAVICVLGAVTGVVLMFVPTPATWFLGTAVVQSCRETAAVVVGTKGLVMGARARQLHHHIAEDRTAQVRFDNRLRQMFRRKSEGSDAGSECMTADVTKTWLRQHSSNFKRTRSYSGSMGDEPGAALPLQSEDSALIFRDDLTRSLNDLQMLKDSLQVAAADK